jgi:RNA-binding motif X-linked protein 2
MSEGDVITVFSQYGEPTYVNLIRDKETGKSKGFAFLKYEDQRSTDLAVDNLGGAVIQGEFEGKKFSRTLKVDHTRYKRKDDENEEGQFLDGEKDDSESEEEEKQRPMLREERELAKLIEEHDEDDPMKAFLVQEKREEVALALAMVGDGKSGKSRRHRHHHRQRRPKNDEDEKESRRSRHKKEGRERKRSRSRDGDVKKRGQHSISERDPEDSERRRSPRRDSHERRRDNERSRR